MSSKTLETTKELKPCPFCACTKIPVRQGNGIGDYWLECLDCGASTKLREDGAGCEKDWNRRPDLAASDAREAQPIYQVRKVGQLKWQDMEAVSMSMFSENADYETGIVYAAPRPAISEEAKPMDTKPR